MVRPERRERQEMGLVVKLCHSWGFAEGLLEPWQERALEGDAPCSKSGHVCNRDRLVLYVLLQYSWTRFNTTWSEIPSRLPLLTALTQLRDLSDLELLWFPPI